MVVKSTYAVAATLVTMLALPRAYADGTAAPGSHEVNSQNFVPPPPATYKANGVTVDEQLGAALPLDARFRDQTGAVVTLGSVIAGDIPTIITFNYSDCPMLCSMQLNGLTAVLPDSAKPLALTASQAVIVGAIDATKKIAFTAGQQFRIVTFVLEPRQPLAKTNATRTKYIERLPENLRADAQRGWTFLSAENPDAADLTDGASGDPAVKRVADAVGFRYVYIKERAEWAHPAALIFVSAKGTVTRYVYGGTFADDVIRESLLGAGVNNPATAVGFMNRCYHFDPDANNYSRAGVMTLRFGALLFLVLMLSAFGLRYLLRRDREPGVIRP
jgi:protein SCO1